MCFRIVYVVLLFSGYGKALSGRPPLNEGNRCPLLLLMVRVVVWRLRVSASPAPQLNVN